MLVGQLEGHLACKNWVVGCWHGYLSGARCKLAYDPADATATHCLFALVKSRLVLLGTPGQRAIKPVCVCACVCACVCVCEMNLVQKSKPCSCLLYASEWQMYCAWYDSNTICQTNKCHAVRTTGVSLNVTSESYNREENVQPITDEWLGGSLAVFAQQLHQVVLLCLIRIFTRCYFILHLLAFAVWLWLHLMRS